VSVLVLENPVRHYAWGRTDGVAALVGGAPSGRPEAELWVGTHPGAPSVVVGDPDGRTLAEVIADDAARWLGPTLADAGHRALPFLLKVLAIGEPLSLQAHPSATQAAAGFAREEAAGIAADAPTRTYRDADPKPEALVALTDTWALCGFREPADAARRVAELGVSPLEPLAAALADAGPDAIRTAMAWLVHLQGAGRDAVAAGVAGAVARVDPDDRSDPLAWVRRLAELHPGDPTIVAPLLLHVLHLQPGHAVHLPAGNLHAYLEGAGVEIMAASDNVVRGGLTPKHVDVDELLDIVRFEPGLPAWPVRATPLTGVTTFDAGEDAFALATIAPADDPVTIDPTGPSLLLATGGSVELTGRDGRWTLDGGRGALAAPGGGPLAVHGPGRLWWATVGDALPT
jgi:mannose-6-phosphate isomerase